MLGKIYRCTLLWGREEVREVGEEGLEAARLKSAPVGVGGRAVCRGFSWGTGSEMAMTTTDFYCAVSKPQILLRSLRITLTRDRDHYYLRSVTEETEAQEWKAV